MVGFSSVASGTTGGIGSGSIGVSGTGLERAGGSGVGCLFEMTRAVGGTAVTGGGATATGATFGATAVLPCIPAVLAAEFDRDRFRTPEPARPVPRFLSNGRLMRPSGSSSLACTGLPILSPTTDGGLEAVSLSIEADRCLKILLSRAGLVPRCTTIG